MAWTRADALYGAFSLFLFVMTAVEAIGNHGANWADGIMLGLIVGLLSYGAYVCYTELREPCTQAASRAFLDRDVYFLQEQD